jgi:predicted RNA binding protein YcfA (HicA-like mRNA interferase family)
MKSADLIKELTAAGFRLESIKGSHHKFKKEGFPPIVVPHPKKDLGKGLVAKLRKVAGLE